MTIPGLDKLPTLAREQEAELALAYRRTRDSRVAQRLVEGHLRLVVLIAKESATAGLPLADLVQEGCIGLLKAIESFEPERGVRLMTYAAYSIRGKIREAVVNGSRPIRIVTTKMHRRLLFAVERELRRSAAQGLEVGPTEIAHRLGAPVACVADMISRLASRRVALNDDGEIPRLAAEGTQEPLDRALNEEARLEVRRALAALEPISDRERAICEDRLMADEPATLQALGKRFGLSRERVRQIEERLKSRLREALAGGDDEYRVRAA